MPSEPYQPGKYPLYDKLRDYMLNVVIPETQRKRAEFLEGLTIDGDIKFQDLPNLSPTELNNQLFILHQKLPTLVIPPKGFVYEELGERNKKAADRINSDEYLPYAAWFEALLDRAPTTPGFDFYLMYEFRHAFGRGVIRAGSKKDTISLLLNPEDFEKGGVFNPDLVRGYEESHYKRLLEKEFLLERLFGEAFDRIEGVGSYVEYLKQQDETLELDLFGDEDKNKTFKQLWDKSLEENFIKNYGRVRIPGMYSVYEKAQFPNIEGPRNYLQLYLQCWRQDFIAKYGDES